MPFRFELEHEDKNSLARLGEFHTLHGSVKTPVFMPVGTLATVKSLDPMDLLQLDTQIVLANTYHLLLRPGLKVFRKFKGIHNFMHWHKPVLTDSGGFQIFSLPRSRKITEEGAIFQSYIEGDLHKLSPESSIEMQQAIGSDIMMVLDQCIDSKSSYEETKSAMELTHRWALRSLKTHTNPDQALFGIVQGGTFPDLRHQSSDFLTQHKFDGFAIGGLAVGETKKEREDFTELVAQTLPRDKPRYLMGVGTPTDLLEAVKRGVDMFDCIIPTKMAQQGNVYTSKGEFKLAQAQFKMSDDKLDENCECLTCQRFSRGYLHHLTKCRESLGWRSLSVHNVWFYSKLMQGMREAIAKDNFTEFYKSQISNWEESPLDDLNVEISREASTFSRPRRPGRGVSN